MKTKAAFIAVVVLALFIAGMTNQSHGYEGYEKTNVRAEGFTIVLNSGCKDLHIVATPWQIDSIRLGIAGNLSERPGSHDLMADILLATDGTVVAVLIDEMSEGVYYAKLVLSSGREWRLDARPSDAIALAVRVDAPVYVKKDIMDRYGIDSCILPST